MTIAAANSLTVGIGKQAFYAQIDLDQAKAYSDAQEGIGAFLEKRSPMVREVKRVGIGHRNPSRVEFTLSGVERGLPVGKKRMRRGACPERSRTGAC